MTETSYTAWDDNLYEWPPPDGWYRASDGKWWPDGYGPSGEPVVPTEAFDPSVTAALADPSPGSFNADQTAVHPASELSADGSASPEERVKEESQRPVYDELPSIDDVFGGKDPFADDDDEPADSSEQADIAVDDIQPVEEDDEPADSFQQADIAVDDVQPVEEDDEEGDPDEPDQGYQMGSDPDSTVLLTAGAEAEDELDGGELDGSQGDEPFEEAGSGSVDHEDVIEAELNQLLSPDFGPEARDDIDEVPSVAPPDPGYVAETVSVDTSSSYQPTEESVTVVGEVREYEIDQGEAEPAFTAPSPGEAAGIELDPEIYDDHSPAVTPAEQDQAPSGPRTVLPLFVVGIGMALILILLLGFFLLSRSDDTANESESDATATSAGGLGSIDQPYEFGTGVVVFYDDEGTEEQRRWVIQVLSPITDGTTQFVNNGGATASLPDGQLLAFARVRVTYQSGSAPGDLSDLFLNSVGSSRITFTQADHGCPAVPDAFDFDAQVQLAETVEGNICWQIPSGDLRQLKLAVEAGPADGTVHMSLN